MPFPKMNFSVKKVTDNTAAFFGALDALKKNVVLVGIPRQKAYRQPEPGQPKVTINNAALGYIHNYGMPSKNIPARPFMEPGIKDVKGPISDRFGQAAKAALTGNKSQVVKYLTAAGIIAANGVKKRINTGPFIPLAPATLAARRRKGRTGTKPLIDTAQLRNSVTFVLRKR